ncbi:hypothetical protein O181_094207 [Austropuccinia psidii MF-1]|uniref:Uncharacterized protein n=1 Tax=Austropuccinia psidii MF-1 TaxID=1389203 RepID=A0A9Q3J2Y8_9BASI|nr:hypothetical protein [Austropuccinia psidii MF-1]
MKAHQDHYLIRKICQSRPIHLRSTGFMERTPSFLSVKLKWKVKGPWKKRQVKPQDNDERDARMKRPNYIGKNKNTSEAQKHRKSRFFWSEDSTKELLDLMMELQMDFENMESTLLGFVPWSRYFKSHEHRKHDYVTLKNLTFETLDRRYKALMTTFRIIKDSCDASGGGGLFVQLQRHHMTQEVYEMLKRINTNNCGLNATGMESGAFPQQSTAVGNTQNLENNENERREDNISNGGDPSGSDNDDTQSRDAHEDGEIRHNEDIFSLRPVSSTSQRPSISGLRRRDSISQSSCLSMDTTRRDHSFMSNMSSNMQSMLSPLMLMLQNGQERADERERLQRAREDAREERRLEREEEQRKEEKARNDQMNMFMMTLLAKVTGINQDQLPRV